MDIGWKWLIPSALINIVLSAFAVFLVQGLNGWRGIQTIEAIDRGLNLTATGKGVMIAFGIAGLFITGALLARRSEERRVGKEGRLLWCCNVGLALVRQ